MTFDDLGLSDTLLRAVADKGYDKPSPIQAQAIPHVLAGKDVMAAAQTGTGKTAAFTLPLLQRLAAGESAKPKQARALILTPTRELAAQVQDSFATYGKHTSLTSTVVFGGVKINPQISRLSRGTDALVATPGRLLDLYNQRAIRFDDLEVLILDEADRMLDMGFIHDIRKIIALLPKDRQTLMFSATFSGEIRKLASGYMRDPVQVAVNPQVTTAEKVEQVVYTCDKSRKAELMSHLIQTNQWDQVLIFTRTKHGANKLTKQLDRDGIRAVAIHGNKSQNARTQALESFKRGKVQALVATDIAARGLDIEQLPQVVNFDLPNIAEDYVHRIGRTGRAGSSGHSYSLVSADEADYLKGIEVLIRKTLPREEIEGFEATHAVPEGKAGGKAATRFQVKRPPANQARRNHGGGGGNRGGNNSGNNAGNNSNRGRRSPRSSSAA